MIEFPKFKPELVEKYVRMGWWPATNISDVFDRSSEYFPDKIAVVDDQVSLTYKELRAKVDNLAGGLLRIGVKKGDCVLLQLPNWAEFVYSLLAIYKVGAVMVLLNIGHKKLEVEHLANVHEAVAYIGPANYRKEDHSPFMQEVASMCPTLKSVISVRAASKAPAFTDRLEDLMTTPLSAQDLEELERRRPVTTDVCHVAPSGGTTGLPKGAPRTHGQYLCNVETLQRGWDMTAKDVCLLVVPVGHNLALLNVVGSVIFNYKLVLLDSTRPEDICRRIQEVKATYMPAVPSLWRKVIEKAELSHYDLSSLTKVLAGGEPSAPELIRLVTQKLGATYINEFGMVEGLLCRSRLEDDVETICESVGKPCCPWDEVKILDPANGDEVPQGVDGELCIRGACIFAGYVKSPEVNARQFTTDGFFKTGDQARILPNGRVKITGRIKDLIIRGGENITPSVVEDLICQTPGILDAAVIGMPDRDLGEKICAYIRLFSDANVDENTIKKFMESKGASKIWIPERFVRIDVFPLTAAGKVDKKALRADIKQRVEAEAKVKATGV
jgi:non-ribosomal peptide synthetase component E (peptide arylation enzyme)